MKKLLLLFLLATIGLVSCKKNEPAPEEAVKIKLLTKITQGDGAQSAITTYTYDDKRRLKTMTTAFFSSTYSYIGDNLSQIEIINNLTTVRTKFSLTFKDGMPVSATQTLPNLTKLYNYQYASNVLKQIDVTELGLLVHTSQYLATGNNLLRKTEEYGQGLIKTEYSYGSNKNPFFNARLNFFTGPSMETMDRYSVNEVLKRTIYRPDGTINHTTANVYTYDDEGFPLTMVSTTTHSGGSTVTKISYEYEVF